MELTPGHQRPNLERFSARQIASLRPEWTSSGVTCSRASSSSLSPSCHIDEMCNPLHADRPEGFRQRGVLVLVEENDLPSKLRRCGRGRGFRRQSVLAFRLGIETASRRALPSVSPSPP